MSNAPSHFALRLFTRRRRDRFAGESEISSLMSKPARHGVRMNDDSNKSESDLTMTPTTVQRPAAMLDIAVVGTGISGLSAAWLLSQRHRVTVYEGAGRVGGHSNTVDVDFDGRTIAVDTGFIVYNEPAYPNLTALFAHLGVATTATDMSFSVSLDRGAYEYAGSNLRGLFAQPSNALRPRFWSMLRDLLRFYREAPLQAAADGDIALDDYLARQGYGRAFREDHLLPMAAAIWSTPAADAGRYPLGAFVRFCENHGLLQIFGRPVWRTVSGGSKVYVARLTAPYRSRIKTGAAVERVVRHGDHVVVHAAGCPAERFDHVVIATHANQALELLDAPSADEQRLLGAFTYSINEAVLHADESFMPRRRAAWASWNYLADTAADRQALSVTYWMNRLQPLGTDRPLLVTLNPAQPPRPELVLHRDVYEHPLFDASAMRAQTALWSLQGRRRTWFCGAHFGAGFHEDGLQAGLAVAEDLGGMRRPWQISNNSGPNLPPAPLACDRRGGCGMIDHLHSALFPGIVTHARFRPTRHALRYRLVSLLIDIDELDTLDRRLRLFSVDRWNMFSFRRADRGDRTGRPLRQQLEAAMAEAGIAAGGGPIRLLTMPRILGWSFNPLSVFFCHRPDGALAAILWEVDNTFGERHAYLIPAEADADGAIRQRCSKSLYVSPFIDMAMTYDFTVRPPGETFAINIAVSDDDGPLMTAHHVGRRVELTDGALLRAFASLPLQALWVLGGIHWEALKLWLKGVGLRSRPPPPRTAISLGSSRPITATRARSA